MSLFEYIAALFDVSRVATQVTALGVIIYASHRSFHLQKEQILEYNSSSSNETTENANSDKDDNNSNGSLLSSFFMPYADGELHLQSKQALMLPLGASVSLLTMFLFFDYLQVIFSIFTAVMAFTALFLLSDDLFTNITTTTAAILSRCIQTQTTSQTCKNSTSTLRKVLAFTFSLAMTGYWALTSHWLVMDLLGVALCVMMISFLRIPNLKTGFILLLGLLFYDVFWVFGTSYFFKRNVMLELATKNSKNPIRIVAERVIQIQPESTLDKSIVKELVLPGKLVFPSYGYQGYSMLGLGDIVMPGILVSFLYTLTSRVYYRTSLLGYFLGLCMASLAIDLTGAAQPALLYLVPCILIPVSLRAVCRGQFWEIWNVSEPSETGKLLSTPHNTISLLPPINSKQSLA